MMGRYNKYGLIILLVLLAGISIWYFALKSGSNMSGTPSKEIYTCSMHPQIIRDKPGNCPICGMTLIRKGGNNQDFEGDSIDHLSEPSDRFVVGNFKVTTPKDTAIGNRISLPGTIAYDPSSAVNISARVSGRIEKIYVKYRYQPVFKGQKLFDIYSPELLTEQQNFIYVLNNDSGNSTIIKAASRKLLLYGMTNTQIRQLVVSRKASPVITVFSPASGIVQGKESMEPLGTQPMVAGSAQSSVLNVKEGDYITKNSVVFRLLNTNKVWGIFYVPPGQIGFIKKDLPIDIITEADNDDTLRNKIGFIEPQFDVADKSSRVRVYLDNSKSHLPVGIRLQGIVKLNPVKGIWLPKEAVVSLGAGKIAFKKLRHGFETMPITTGITSHGFIQVISGVSARDTLAANAQFLIDSESFIK